MRLQTLTETEMMATLVALALLLISAYTVGTLMERMKAPRVVGEITGGILLGETCLYHFSPETLSGIFMAYDGEGMVLNIFYQLGLIFLMFLSGYNTKLEIDRTNAKTIGCIFVGATILPMLGAVPFIPVFRNAFAGEISSDVPFALVFAIGVAITSIPVISKIFFDMGIMNTKFSNTVLTVSTFQDLCLWILLNAATRIAKTGELKAGDMFIVVGFTLGLFAAAKLISGRVVQNELRSKAITFHSLCFTVLLLVCAGLSVTGINMMYSAFLTGYLVKSLAGDVETFQRMKHLSDFVFSFFVPVYFALVGLQLNLLHGFSFPRFCLFFGVAFGLEAVGTLLMLRFTNLNRRTKLNFAVTMNARGGPGIVLATVAYSYDIINTEFFTVLILTTMLSSLIAGYWLRREQKMNEQIFMQLTD